MAGFPIIEKLGGRQTVFEHLQAKGLVSTVHALRMWERPERGVIPGDAARELMAWADDRGVTYSADDFSFRSEAA